MKWKAYHRWKLTCFRESCRCCFRVRWSSIVICLMLKIAVMTTLTLTEVGWSFPLLYVDCFYVAVFSASEQTHCVLVACNWMSDCSFTQRIECHHALMETKLTLTEVTWWRGWFNYWYLKMNQKCSIWCQWVRLIMEGPTSHPIPHAPKPPQTKQLQKAKTL